MNGTAREAIGFYEKVSDAENLGVLTLGDMTASPDSPLPGAAKNL